MIMIYFIDKYNLIYKPQFYFQKNVPNMLHT